MNRRTALHATGTALCLAVAGCVGSGTTDDSTPDDSAADGADGTATTTPESEGSENASAQTTEPATSTDEPEDDSGGTEGPRAMIESLFEAFETGDPETINGFLHDDAPLDPMDEEEATGYAENPPTIEEMELVEVTDSRATVDVTMHWPEEDTMQTVTMELRTADGEWKLWDTSSSSSDVEFPRVAFTYELEGESLEITHDTGEAVSGDELFVRGECLGSTGSWSDLGGDTDEAGEILAGHSVTVEVEGSCQVRLVWDDGKSSATLSTRMIGDDTNDEGNSDVSETVAEYLQDAKNFEGEVDDWTGVPEVELGVGTGENGLAFEPPAIRVSPGTTVIWEWTGEGGSHNVVAENGAFESELASEYGTEFSHTFDSAGTTLYYCAPHKAIGMKGAVIVTEE